MVDVSQEICKRLQNFLRMKVQEGKYSRTERFNLSFRFDDRDYTTRFFVIIYPGSPKIKLFNSCLTIDITHDSLEGSEISSNTEPISCFEPRLVSDRRNKPGLRVTSTDILQTLKTKLAFCLSPNISSLPLVDGATIGIVELYKFNILRGKPAIYEKYGYRCASMDQFKAYINKLTWSDLDETSKQIILDAINESIIFEPDELLTDIMNMISLESENTYSNYNNPSSIIFNTLYKNTDEYDEDTLKIYNLEKNNAIWKLWDSRLLFTDLTFITSGGSRTRRKSIRRRRTSRKRNNGSN